MPASPAPEVSVVIVAWNSAAFLCRCLDALAAQTYRDFEVILVDNASTDGSTIGLAEDYPTLDLRLERLSSNTGFAAANNVAAGHARGRWLALLNADAFPEPDWLEALMKAAEPSADSFFACRQIQANRPHLLDGEGDLYHVSGLAQRRYYNYPVFRGGSPYEVFSACAAAELIPLEAFRSVGGFDEDYFAYHEDVDLGFRLRLRGLTCIFVPAAVVHHVGTGSTGPRSRLSTYYGHRNLVWTYFKNMPAPWIWIYLPLHLSMTVVTLLYFVLIGQGGTILRAKLDALRGLPSALRKRRGIQNQRRVATGDLLRAMARNPLAPLGGWFTRHFPPAE